MLAKVWASLVVLLAFSLEVHAHAAISPVLGLSGEPKRRDVKRPTVIRPCGLGVKVASALDKSTPVQAAPDGTFTATITNFNPGRDGSRQVTARVDAAATGKNANFVDMTVSQNGDAAPPDLGSQQIVASLPAGTKCTGGASGDLCLVSFKTLGRFGNCVAVQQAGGAGAGGTGTDATTDTGTGAGAAGADATGSGAGAAGAGAGTSAGTGGKTGAGKKATSKSGATQANQANSKLTNTKGRLTQGGTRAARALLADLKIRGEELSDNVRRGVAGLIWA